MQPNPGKPEALEHDPEGLLLLLDLELRQKRALWERSAQRHRTSRMIWGFSIFVVMAAAFFALFFLFSQTSEEKMRSRGPAISDSTDR